MIYFSTWSYEHSRDGSSHVNISVRISSSRPTGAPGVVEHHQARQQLRLVPVYPEQLELPDGGVGRRGDVQDQEARRRGGVLVKLRPPHRLR